MIYLNNLSNNKNSIGKRILITRSKMSWVNESMYDLWLQRFAPSEKLWRDAKFGNINDEEYITRFFTEFTNDDIQELIRLNEEYGDITLLCYCAKDSICHRYIIKEILFSKGIECISL